MSNRALAGCGLLFFTGTAAMAAPAIVVTARSGEAGAQEVLADGNMDRARHVLAVDAQGNTYVVGARRVGAVWRYHTTKYKRDGSVAWNAVQAPADFPGEYPYGIGVDAAGNVYVSGTNYTQFITLKYDSAGVQQWERRYLFPGGLYQQPRAMAVDAAGNVYVTGRSQAGGSGIEHFDYATVKYDTDGNQQWAARYNGPDGLGDEVKAIALDGDGNVYVTGASAAAGNREEFATVKYNAAGVQQWAARYGAGSYGDGASGVVVNGDSVVVTGQSNTGTRYDAVTIAYDRASGAQQWIASISGTNNTFGTALTRDAQGNVFVTGAIWDMDNRFLVAKYDSAGVRQWVKGYLPFAGISGSNAAYAIALAPDGGVVAAGRAIGFQGFDYGVVKYDTNGNLQWSQLFDSPQGGLNDQAGALVVRDDGIVVVSGTEAYSQGSGGTERRTTLFIADGVQDTTPQISTTSSVTGQPYAVNVSVRGKVGLPAGSVQVSDGEGNSCGIALVDGDGSCTLANAAAGSKTISAAFSPDAPALFAAGLAGVTHIVDKAATQLGLSTPGWSYPGDSFTAVATLGVLAPGAGTPSGSLTVGDGVDSCVITLPADSCTLTLTTPGIRSVSAAYAGDANFLADAASFTHRVNRAPVAADDSYSMAEDGSLSVAAQAGVLANDDDDDGDALSVTPATLQAGGIGGSVVLHADGSFDYTPPADANGTATFAYSANDGIDSDGGSVSIEVRAVNDPPSFVLGAVPDHAAASSGAHSVPGFVTQFSPGPSNEAGQALAGLLSAIDSDTNDILDAVSLDLDGNLSYQLTGRGGTATVSVRARDSGGSTDGGNDTSAAQTFTISVASGVDLVVSVGNDRQFLSGGSAVSYIAELRNLGPDAAVQAQVSIPRPANLSAFSWTCARSDASPCAVTSGSGDVQQLADVPIGVSVTYQVSATVVALPELPVTLGISVSPASGQTEIQPASNSASDTDVVGIFADGFDG